MIHSCLLFTKLRYKWIKNLHIKPETLKFIEEKVEKTLEDIGTGEKFLNRTAMACAVRSKIDKWDLIKLQSFCKAKDTVNKTKWQPTDWVPYTGKNGYNKKTEVTADTGEDVKKE